jgi:hypothetical protein
MVDDEWGTVGPRQAVRTPGSSPAATATGV